MLALERILGGASMSGVVRPDASVSLPKSQMILGGQHFSLLIVILTIMKPMQIPDKVQRSGNSAGGIMFSTNSSISLAQAAYSRSSTLSLDDGVRGRPLLHVVEGPALFLCRDTNDKPLF